MKFKRQFAEEIVSGSIRMAVRPMYKRMPVVGQAIEIRCATYQTDKRTGIVSETGVEHIADAICTGAWLGEMTERYLTIERGPKEDEYMTPSALDPIANRMGYASWFHLLEDQWLVKGPKAYRAVSIIEWVPVYHGRFQVGTRTPTPRRMKNSEREARSLMAWGVIPRNLAGVPEVNPYRKIQTEQFPDMDYAELSKVTHAMQTLEIGEAMVISTESLRLFKKWIRDNSKGWKLIERPVLSGTVAIWRIA